MFEKIFKNFIEKKILKDIKKLHKFRTKSFRYIEKNQKIGVIVDVNDNEIDTEAKGFIDFLKKDNDVDFIKFVNYKFKRKQVVPEKTFSLHGMKYLNNEVLKSFLNKNYDILIVITKKEYIKLHHIVAKTIAELKVSPRFDVHNFADLTFIINQKVDCTEYFNAIKKYLFKK